MQNEITAAVAVNSAETESKAPYAAPALEPLGKAQDVTQGAPFFITSDAGGFSV